MNLNALATSVTRLNWRFPYFVETSFSLSSPNRKMYRSLASADSFSISCSGINCNQDPGFANGTRAGLIRTSFGEKACVWVRMVSNLRAIGDEVAVSLEP
jgi:hypothetical protein